MALIQCIECGREGVSATGICPVCRQPPQGRQCLHCGEATRAKDILRLGICRKCTRLLRERRSRNARGHCPECTAPLEFTDFMHETKDTGQRTRAANCSKCGFKVEWSQCDLCEDFFRDLRIESIAFPQGWRSLFGGRYLVKFYEPEQHNVLHCADCTAKARQRIETIREKWYAQDALPQFLLWTAIIVAIPVALIIYTLSH